MKTIAMLLFCLASLSANAESFVDRLHFEASAATGFESNDMTPIDFSFKAHADVISSIYVFVSAEGNKSLYESSGARTYLSGESLGGGLGVQLLGKKSALHALDIRAKAMTSVGNTDWKRTSYDAGLAWYIKTQKSLFSPVVEVGYRYIDSRESVIENYSGLYVSFGIRY